MEAVARLFGSGTAAAGTLLQLAVIAATIPAFPRPVPCLHCHDFEPIFLPGWTPVIENPGSGDWLPEISRCPGRQVAGTDFRLDHAPLPPAFRPFDYKDIVVACVRVDPAGSVRSVKLISGTGRAGLDRELVHTIGRQWRLAPMSGFGSRPGWQRIRLSTNHPIR